MSQPLFCQAHDAIDTQPLRACRPCHAARERFRDAIFVLLVLFPVLWPGGEGTPGAASASAIVVKQTDEAVSIETDRLQVQIAKQGYVSGTKAQSLLDRQTGARDAGFGLHIMDFLLAPGWRDDGYTRDARLHGKLPKHYVEGPQICTQAKRLEPEVLRGDGFVAVRLRFTFTEPGKGYKAGSRWLQTLVFQPGVRYFLSAEEITSVNDVDELFYRIDMPGHVRHRQGDTFAKVYLSYHGEVSAAEFEKDFAPDERLLYRRDESNVPARMIRAYQVKVKGKPGPWLAGMTLDPSAVSEAWCHERGYVCMIQENHRRKTKAGETFGAAYVVGWFDNVADMEKTYDRFKGTKRLIIKDGRFLLQ
jgi:hypothetical protein